MTPIAFMAPKPNSSLGLQLLIFVTPSVVSLVNSRSSPERTYICEAWFLFKAALGFPLNGRPTYLLKNTTFLNFFG